MTRIPQAKLLAFVLYILGVVYLSFGMHISSDVYDEGIALFGGWRVARGEMPYRDFWTLYGPAQFYVYGLLFKLFGPSLLLAHVWEAVMRSFIALGIFFISRRLLPVRFAFAAWLLTLVWLFTVGLHGYNLFPASACLLMAIHVSEGRPLGGARLCAVSAVAALAFFFRYEYGALCLLAAWLCSSGGGLKNPAKSALLFGVFLLPGLSYFLARVPLQELYECLVKAPLLIYPHTRHLSLLEIGRYIGASNVSRSFEMWLTGVVVLFFPPVVSACGIAIGIVSRQKWRGTLNILTCSLIALAVALTNIQRYDFPHAFAAYPLAIVVLLACVRETLGMAVPYRLAVQFFCVVIGLPLLAQPIKFNAAMLWKRSPIALTKDQRDVIEYVSSRWDSGVPIFVGNSEAAGEQGNNVLLYFLLSRPSATRYHELHPGVADIEDVQESIVKDLEKSAAPLVLLAKTGFGAPSARRADVLSRYIAAHYKRQGEAGGFEVLERLPMTD